MAGSDSKPLSTSSSAGSRSCSSPPPTTSSKDSQGPKRHRRILDHLPTGSDQDPSVSPKNASNGVSRDGRAATGEGMKCWWWPSGCGRRCFLVLRARCQSGAEPEESSEERRVGKECVSTC